MSFAFIFCKIGKEGAIKMNFEIWVFYKLMIAAFCMHGVATTLNSFNGIGVL